MGHNERHNGFHFQYVCIQAMLLLYPVSSKYIIGIACTDASCPTGEFFNGETRSCQPCKNEAFLNLTKNLCFECKICTMLYPYEKEHISTPCSAVSDDVIDCDSGFLQTNTMNDVILCERCSACPLGYVVMTECGPRDDTLCAASMPDINPPAPTAKVFTTTNSRPTADNDSEQSMHYKSFLNDSFFQTTTMGIQKDEYHQDGLDQLRTLMNATNGGLNKSDFRLSWPWVVSIVSVIMVFTVLFVMTLKFRGKLKCSSVCRCKRGFTRLRNQGSHSLELEEYVGDTV